MIEKNKLTFDILSDAGNAIAAQFGLRFAVADAVRKVYQEKFGLDMERFNGDPSWTLPIPARFIVDCTGRIRYANADPDYTVRPEPSDTVEALATLVID